MLFRSFRYGKFASRGKLLPNVSGYVGCFFHHHTMMTRIEVCCVLIDRGEKVDAVWEALSVEVSSDQSTDELKKLVKKDAPVPLGHDALNAVWKRVDPDVNLGNMDFDRFNKWLSDAFDTDQRKVKRLMKVGGELVGRLLLIEGSGCIALLRFSA